MVVVVLVLVVVVANTCGKYGCGYIADNNNYHVVVMAAVRILASVYIAVMLLNIVELVSMLGLVTGERV